MTYFSIYWNKYQIPGEMTIIRLLKALLFATFNIPFLIWHYFNNSPYSADEIKTEFKKLSKSQVGITSKNIIDRAAKTIDKASSAVSDIADKSIDDFKKTVIKYPGIDDVSSKKSLLSKDELLMNLLKNSKK